MFKRLRTMHISLAAKCQILFGAAVVLIIGAALFVPWNRMEQLMERLNERAASTLAQHARMEHVTREWGRFNTAGRATPTTNAATTQPEAEAGAYVPPRLVSVAALSDESLPRFEKRALRKFDDAPDTPFLAQTYETKDGTERYRYAMPVFSDPSCVHCHAAGAAVPVARGSAATGPTTLPSLAALHAVRPNDPSPAPPAFGSSDHPKLLGLISVDIPSQMEANQLYLNRVFILTAGLFAGTLAIVVFYLITDRLILQPVRVLQETAEKVSEGDLNIRSDINTGDEFQQLSETFNTMLTNLKQSADQLRSINKSLDLKLVQLAESNVTLYEANRLKSEFLANVSHELRTPLNSILGFAELLRDALAAPPEAKPSRYLQNILNSGKNLLELINDLLDLAKIEAGRMDVRAEPLSLGDVFEGLANILKPLAEQKNLSIVSSTAPDVPIVQTDPAKLQQVLYNFLSNAIKFSPQSGRVTLAARREGEEQIRISVTDQGPGIDPEKQGMIFEKFRQIDASVTRQHSGTGLGLAISKELTSLLGGSIGVDSQPGQGATFWVVLPLKIQAGARDVRSKAIGAVA